MSKVSKKNKTLGLEKIKVNKNSTFRDLLSHELDRRQLKNPSYSLRAFASFLKINPSFLSKYLKSERQMSIQKALEIIDRLGWGEQAYSKIARKDQSVSYSEKNEIDPPTFLSPVTKDDETFLLDWVIGVLYAYFGCKENQVKQEKEIASELSLDEKVVKSHISHLLDRGFLVRELNSIYQNIENLSLLGTPFTQRDFRPLQKSLQKMSIYQLENVAVEKRDHSSITLLISEDMIPVVKEKIKDFRRSLKEELENNSSSKRKLHQLLINFFPVTGDFEK